MQNERPGRPNPAANLVPVMDAAQLNAFIREAFPQLNRGGRDYHVTAIFPGGCTVRLEAGERHLRPGNTVSGPSLFTLADIGGYACVLSHVGPDALSVTTNLTINFMRKAEAGPVDAHCRILKLGRNLMVYDVDMIAGANGDLVAQASGTYSIPPKRLA